MIHLENMNKKFIFLSKIIGIIFFYSLIFVASVFFTMSFLIKGEEINTPDLIGKSLKEAYKIASQKGIYIKKTDGKVGNYIKNYKPLTVIGQIPVARAKIKKKSSIQIFVTPELVEIAVPDLSGYDLKKAEEILEKNSLRKGFVSYMDADDVPIDFIITQSYPDNSKVPKGTEIDILICGGKREKSYIMPDLISMKAENIVLLFESMGFKKPNIKEVNYARLEPGIIVNQSPTSGFRINSKNLISIEVSK